MKLTLVFLSAVLAHGVFADCSIKNDTKYDFTVTYGNVSNRSFGANHIENFPKGSISGTAGAKSFSASCSGSESLVVTEQNGAIVVKKR